MANLRGHQARTRYEALDGLRGLAALVVVVHHCLLVSPELVTASYAGGFGPTDSWVWWMTFTPLHLLWAGKEAVYVFFILSGFVLTLPFFGEGRPTWTGYYLRRVLRIYPPVWASLLFAAGTVLLFPRVADSQFSSWVNLHSEPSNILNDAVLLRGTGSLNSPLWSLQWEMAFSLLLPLYLVLVTQLRRIWFLGLPGIVLLAAALELTYMTEATYLLVFAVGALMAASCEALQKWGSRLRPLGWASVLGASAVLLCFRWIIPQARVPITMAVIGGALLIFVFIAWRPAVGLGSKQLVRWLGSRSFSLYLIHEPIVVSVAIVLNTTQPLTVGLVATPLSLLAAEVFFRLVEQPSHRFSRTVGKALEERTGRRDVVAGM
ncbi:acyltransferase family protein [Pseudarthrobacter siccitolerans]